MYADEHRKGQRCESKGSGFQAEISADCSQRRVSWKGFATASNGATIATGDHDANGSKRRLRVVRAAPPSTEETTSASPRADGGGQRLRCSCPLAPQR